MDGGMYGVFIICTLVIVFDKLVQANEICRNYAGYATICDSGYQCCDDNTRCCSTGLTFGAIIGIVFGVLFILTICVVCAVIVTKKKNKNNVVRARLSNHPQQQTVTITNIGNNPGGYGTHGQPVHQYGYGFGQPQPVHVGMIHAAPPPYNQNGVYPFNQPGHPMMPTRQAGMSGLAAESSPVPMFRPLAPAYAMPARSMFKLNAHKSSNTD